MRNMPNTQRGVAVRALMTLGAFGFSCPPQVTAQAPPRGYAIFDLGSWSGTSSAYGINDTCQIVGEARDASLVDNAFLWDQGALLPLSGIDLTCGSEAYAINDAGQIVGEHGVRNTYCEYDAFLWDAGTVLDLPPLGGLGRSYAEALNETGEVVGWSPATGGDHRATLWLPAPHYGLPAGANSLGCLPGDDQSYAYGINEVGDVVGYSTLAPLNPHRAFLWLPTARYGLPAGINPLGTLGGTHSSAAGVNDSGEVVGYSDNAGGFAVAFLWLPAPAYGLSGGMHDMQTTGGPYSFASAINNQGDIVGMSATTTPPPAEEAACIWYAGTPGPLDLNTQLPPGSPWILRNAADVNDRGQIVGWGLKNFVARAFLLTPVVPPDADADGDVDAADFAVFQQCFTGDGGGPWAPGCGWADFDTDSDVDLDDYAHLSSCMTGPGIPALPGC